MIFHSLTFARSRGDVENFHFDVHSGPALVSHY